jgi:hypothetical protein
MEFKNFENKLIIEKITNYCIENNISAQKINALTTKIKFGKLNEADSWTNWAGDMAGKIGDMADKTGFTSAGRYKKSIAAVQDNLQKAMDYLKAVNADLEGANNIFTKNKVSLDPAKQSELQNAVGKLKDVVNSYSPAVANSLKQIGGQISGVSNYGDEQSFEFDEMFPELKTGGTLAQAFTTAYTPTGGTFDKQADLNRILLQSRQNILKTFKVLDTSKHGEFIQKIKTNVARVISYFKNPTKVADGYALLNTIVGGTHTPTPAKTILTDRQVVVIIKGNSNLQDVYKNELTNPTNLPELKTIFEKIWDGTNAREMSDLVMQAVNATPKANTTSPAVPAADPTVVKDLMDKIENLFV